MQRRRHQKSRRFVVFFLLSVAFFVLFASGRLTTILVTGKENRISPEIFAIPLSEKAGRKFNAVVKIHDEYTPEHGKDRIFSVILDPRGSSFEAGVCFPRLVKVRDIQKGQIYKCSLVVNSRGFFEVEAIEKE